MRLTLTAAPFIADPARPRHLDNSANLGLYLLAAVAEEAGHTVAVVDPSLSPSRMPAGEFRAAFSGSDVIGLSATTSVWPETRVLLDRLIRELPDRPALVLGGPHPSIFDERALSTAPLDYVVRGEGERTLVELLEALSAGRDPAGLAGLSCLRGGKLVRGPDRTPLMEAELSALPLPRYDLVPAGYYQALPVETSRGCWHRCAFCSITSHRHWRDLGADRLGRALETARDQIGKYTRGAIHLIDDCFLARGRKLGPLADAMAKNEIPLAFSTRVSDLRRPEALEFYARLPVSVCELGVECGYDEGMKRVGKGITTKDALDLAGVLQSRGLAEKVLYAYIIGLPWEGQAECLRTLKFGFDLCRARGGRLQAGWFLLYPGSEIFREQERFGISVPAEVYDRPHFWRDHELFARMHPRLDPEGERKVAYTARFLAQMHPEVNAFLMM